MSLKVQLADLRWGVVGTNDAGETILVIACRLKSRAQEFAEAGRADTASHRDIRFVDLFGEDDKT